MRGKCHLSFITGALSDMRRDTQKKSKEYDGVNIPAYEKAMAELKLYNKALAVCEYLPEYVDYSTLNNFKIAYIVSHNDEMLAIIKVLMDIYNGI